MNKFLILILVLLFSIFLTNAQSMQGLWKTIDDETNKPKSEVKIFIKEDKLYGKITKLYREAGEELDPVCSKCSDYRKNKKIVGMIIITALTKDDDQWEDDDAILDPKNGKIYDCKIWLDENNPNILYVRGYIGFFFRTQTWYRIR